MASNEHDQDAWHQCMTLLNNGFKDNLQQELLELLLTPDERDALTTRVKIIEELLRKSKSQRELKEELQVGIATITRGSNSLKSASTELLIWLKRELEIDVRPSKDNR